jgi:glycerophosphoryl diester phosphodiesterase
MPTSYIALLLHELTTDWQETANTLNCVSINMNEACVTLDLSNKIKEMNKQLLAYTVNETKRAEELFSWGVDALFTDKPDKIMVKR